MAPKVSICIPAYRGGRIFSELLNSIKNQDFTDYEVIITDDSPDYSIKDIVQDFNFGQKLLYFRNNTNLGSPRNWNEAISKANGELIKIMHHDDWFSSSKSLNEFVTAMEKNPSADFGFSQCSRFTENIEYHSPYRISKEQLIKINGNIYNLFIGNYIGSPSVCIFRNHKGYAFDNRLKWLVDVDFYISLLKCNKNIVYIDKPLINIGIHEKQITKSVESDRSVQIFENLYLIDKHDLFDANIKNIKGYLYGLFEYNNVETYEELQSVCAPFTPNIFKDMFKYYRFKSLLYKALTLLNRN